jgi:lipoprotein-anchoring transpeptidase ErfK/SrfK
MDVSALRVIIISLALTMAMATPAHAGTRLLRVIAPTVATTNPGGGTVVKRLTTTTPYGADQLQLRVLRSVPGEINPTTGLRRTYYYVHLPYRPNNLRGWVSSDKVQVITTPYRIVIRRATRSAILYQNNRVAMRWRVVIGKTSTPTPAGEFAIYGKTTRNHAFDGTGILPFAYSNVHKQFDGGPGMVAIHGRSGDSFATPLGTAGSNGCVRSNNNVVEYLLKNVPIGTPVSVR